MAQNTYVPTVLRNANSYGWAKRSAPNVNNVPLINPQVKDADKLRQQVAYEWLDWSDDPSGGSSNPPFAAAGKSQPGLSLADGSVPRVLRGYIRRAETSPSDPLSSTRLYFMYNPPSITREYASYLDQGALDPFNTVYQSGNLVAPPSFMDFSFELFFDRQIEAMNANHPGVFVDLEYFDMVVRNVVPTQDPTNGALPDNGVMMVNPRDITVLFSEQITVQGRPLNSSVTFEKFTHRMVPTRMRIRLTMRVIYFGPVREQGTFVPEEVASTSRIPFPLGDPVALNFTYSPIEWPTADDENQGDDPNPNDPGDNTSDTRGDDENIDPASVSRASPAAKEAVQKAHDRWKEWNTKYSYGRRRDLWNYADCSSFVWGGYAASGHAAQVGWDKFDDLKYEGRLPDIPGSVSIPGSVTMLDGFRSMGAANVTRLFGFPNSPYNDSSKSYNKIMSVCQKGDLLFRVGHPDRAPGEDHVAFFWGRTASGNGFILLHAMSNSLGVGFSEMNPGEKCQYNYGVRPLPNS